MKVKLIVFIFASFIILSCSNNGITSVEDQESGEISVSLDKENAPPEVTEVLAKLSRQNFNSITKSLSFINDSTAEIIFESISIGKWKIRVEALNSEGDILYFGETLVDVLPNTVTPVNLTLMPTTGSIVLTVNWGFTEYSWLDYSLNPIIVKFDGEFDYKGVAEPIVTMDHNGFNMWYTGLSGAGSQIYHAHSTNGINWERSLENPILNPGVYPAWDSRNVASGPVLYDQEHYILYYNGRDSRESDSSPWKVGYAVSQDGINWEKYPNSLFEGTFNSWDLKIAASDIKIINNKYFMYYTGKNEIYDHKIGLAISDDGMNFQRYSTKPVLSPDKYWEGSGIYWPSIIEHNGKFIMIYQSSIVSPVSGFGLAYSTDGINWVKDINNPVFTTEDTQKKWDKVLYPNLKIVNNEYYLYYTGYNQATDERAICLARKQIN